MDSRFDLAYGRQAHPAEALGVEATERRGPREGGRGGRGRRGDFGGDEQGGGRGGGRRGRGRGSEGRGPPPANGNALFPVEVARRLFTAEMQVVRLPSLGWSVTSMYAAPQAVFALMYTFHRLWPLFVRCTKQGLCIALSVSNAQPSRLIDTLRIRTGLQQTKADAL